MKIFSSLILSAALIAPFQVVRSADIADRPEKLSFPPLKYDAPVPDQYRVQLKSGPVVYIVPDHERPAAGHCGCRKQAGGWLGLPSPHLCP